MLYVVPCTLYAVRCTLYAERSTRCQPPHFPTGLMPRKKVSKSALVTRNKIAKHVKSIVRVVVTNTLRMKNAGKKRSMAHHNKIRDTGISIVGGRRRRKRGGALITGGAEMVTGGHRRRHGRRGAGIVGDVVGPLLKTGMGLLGSLGIF